MNLREIAGSSNQEMSALIGLHEPYWYAVYTYANHEKSVARQFEFRAIEHFLPLYERMSQWKDRRLRIQVPLFSCYVFVRLALAEKLRIVEVPGVVRLVGFNGRPSPLPEHEIQGLRAGLSEGAHAAPYPYLQVGHRVRVRSGALQGLSGILLKKKNDCRFVLSMELIQRSIAIEIDAADVEAL